VIISASRRTDIPAFYAPWFMQRIREGCCTVPNPLNPKQVSLISLLPQDVEAIVFWSKNPAPLLPFLSELSSRGHRFYFQYTVNNYPPELEPHVPSLDVHLSNMEQLAKQLGPEKVIWRYDPIVLSPITPVAYHCEQFHRLAQLFSPYTRRAVISIVDAYNRSIANLRNLSAGGVPVDTNPANTDLAMLLTYFSATVAQHGLSIHSCAEHLDLTPYGIMPGKCVDDQYIRQIFGVSVTGSKDKSQREQCGCVQSRDIGMYSTCLHGCMYCYAGTNKLGLDNFTQHFPDSPSLIGRYLANSPAAKPESTQTKLF